MVAGAALPSGPGNFSELALQLGMNWVTQAMAPTMSTNIAPGKT